MQPVALGESVMSVLSVSASREAKSVTEVLLSDLRAAGVTPTVTADGSGVVVPTDTLTPELRARITQNKTALIRLLIEAANDAHHHPELAPPTAPAHDRLLETPPHLRQGLYIYLRDQLRQPHLLWRTRKRLA